MLLAQGRLWRATWIKNSDSVGLETIKSPLAEGSPEFRELRVEVPIKKWSLVVKNVHSDRKLLGGVLLDYAKHKDRVSEAVGNDRLFIELQRVIIDATLALLEAEKLALTQPETAAD